MNLSTILRIAAILLGIASAVLLAHSAFGIRFNEDFLLFLDLVRDTVGLIVRPFELIIVTPVVTFLHDQGFVFDLYDHWKNAFVLLWLLFAAWSRAYGSGHGWLSWTFHWVWAGVCGLVAGVLAGTVPLDHPAVFWWPVAGLGLFVAGVSALGSATLGRDPIASIVLVLMMLGLTAHSAIIALGIVPPLFMFFETSPSPGLAMLASGVAYIGVIALIIGASERGGDGETFLQKWLGGKDSHLGLDILAVLGGATTIVYVAHFLA